MEELGLLCDTEIPTRQKTVDTNLVYFRKSLELIMAKSQQTLQNQVKLGQLKARLRQVEDDLVKALAVKTCKEAKRMSIADSVAATKARTEELKRITEDRRAKKDEYGAIISRQAGDLAACEEMRNKDAECRGEIEEAISWYNKVLGFRIECGHGVKFIFTNIHLNSPKKEYFFTVRHENNIYTLLDCDPHLNDTKEMIHELNRNNGLFKFVRTMRERFQKAAACGIGPQVISPDQASSLITESTPVTSVSPDSRTESPAKQKELQPGETNRPSRKFNYDRGGQSAILLPGFASSFCQSPRSKVKK